MQMTKTIEAFLDRYGWRYHSNGQNCWMTGWQSEHRSYPLLITLNDSWMSLQVVPLMKLGVEWDAWPEAMRTILDLNHEAKLVKIGIDEFGDLSLSLYLLSEGLTYSQFETAVGVIGYYADKLFDELQHYLSSIGFEFQTSYHLS